MKLLIYSDLHHEMDRQFGLPFFQPPQAAIDAADAIILAGDIDVGTQHVPWICETFGSKPVILIAGNHEFHHGGFFGRFAQLAEAAHHARQRGHQIHFLENGSLVLADKSGEGKDAVRFLGCTLWTDMKFWSRFPSMRNPRVQEEMKMAMPEYRLVYNELDDFAPLTTEDTISRHNTSRAWLKRELKEPSAKDKGFIGKTVVVTHFLPSRLSISERFKKSPLNPAFASHLDALIKPPVSLWVHGHTHDRLDYQVNGVRVYCNPRGYPRERLKMQKEGSYQFRVDELIEI